MLSTSRPGAKNFSDQQSRRARRSDSTSSPRPGTNVVHRKSSGKMDSPAKKITGPTAIRGQNVDRFLPVRRTSRPGISVLHETERRLERSIGGGPANKMTEAIEKKREETVDIVGSSEKPPNAPISTGVFQHLIQKAHRMAIGKRQTIVVGPWGGSGGNGWDDGSYDGIREIQISHRDTIGSLSVVYDWNGEPFAGPKHASIHPFKNEKIELEFPDEFLVSVSGHTAPLSWLGTKTPVIRSLTFETNKRIFGPYGAEEGTTFNFPIENGLIVGFKGRSGELLDAIGFHLSI